MTKGTVLDDKGDGSECHLNPKVTFRTVPFVIPQKVCHLWYNKISIFQGGLHEHS